MQRLLFFILITVLMSCNPSISIYEKEKCIGIFRPSSEKDTTIQVKDFFITYRKVNGKLEGNITSPFNDSRGDFQSFSEVKIYLKENQFIIDN